jgi:hypothetical protein
MMQELDHLRNMITLFSSTKRLIIQGLAINTNGFFLSMIDRLDNLKSLILKNCNIIGENLCSEFTMAIGKSKLIELQIDKSTFASGLFLKDLGIMVVECSTLMRLQLGNYYLDSYSEFIDFFSAVSVHRNLKTLHMI